MDIQNLLNSTQASTGVDALYGNNKQQQAQNEDSATQIYSWKSDSVSISAEALAKSRQASEEGGNGGGGEAGVGGGGGSASDDNDSKLSELQGKLQSLISQLAAARANSDDPSAGSGIQAQIAAVSAEIAALQAAG